MEKGSYYSIERKMKEKKHQLFINGRYVDAGERLYFTIENPANGTEIAEVAEGRKVDINHAIDSAEHAFESWKKVSNDKRADIIEKMGVLFGRKINEFAYIESYQTGRPIREMKAQLARLPEWFKYYASLLRTMQESVYPFGDSHHAFSQRSPLGVVALITPWNHPLLILTKKLVPALAAGNCVVIKPSELAPLTTLELGDIANKAGLPNGVMNIVPGFGATAGAALTNDKRIAKIDVTGGTETGKVIAGIAGSNLTKISCELGGKASVLFFDDVDIDKAVNAAAFAAFIATGQTCVQGARLLVHHNLYTDFVEKLTKKVSDIKIGDPLDLNTQMGPLISANQRNLVDKYTKIGLEEGAKLAYGGKIPEGYNSGYYYEPTIFADVKNDMRIAQEEIFGPITTIIPFTDEEEAIKIANKTEFGLAMGVWTNDVSRSLRITEKLESGVVWVNDHHRIDPAAPWGGIKQSGIGKENGINCYKEYTKEKTIIINKSQVNFDWYKDGEIQRYS